MKFFGLLLLSLLCITCKTGSENQDQPAPDLAGVIDTSVTFNFEIVSLPAPLQIPSALQSLRAGYLESNMLDPATPTTTSTTQAVALGVYGVDIGYSLLFDKNQEALSYFERALRIAGDLNLLGNVDPSLPERFSNNIHDKDSTTFILLHSFHLFQKFLQDSHESKTGLYIFTGSFVEGLTLSLAHLKAESQAELNELIGQQKMFYDNLVKLLEKNDKNSQVYRELKKLDRFFENVTVSVIEVNQTTQRIYEVKIPAEEIGDYLKLSLQVRSALLK